MQRAQPGSPVGLESRETLGVRYLAEAHEAFSDSVLPPAWWPVGDRGTRSVSVCLSTGECVGVLFPAR